MVIGEVAAECGLGAFVEDDACFFFGEVLGVLVNLRFAQWGDVVSCGGVHGFGCFGFGLFVGQGGSGCEER